MNSKDIDVIADDPSMGGPPVPILEPTIDDYDIFPKDVMSYS
jgi:hypothetical protein